MPKKTTITLDDFRQIADGVSKNVTPVEIPGSKKVAYARELDGHNYERLIHYGIQFKEDGGAERHGVEAMARTVILGICDEAGNPLFENTEESLNFVKKLPPATLKVMAEAVVSFNGLSPEEDDEIKKNSTIQ